MNSRRTLTYFHSGSELIVRAPHTRIPRSLDRKSRMQFTPRGFRVSSPNLAARAGLNTGDVILAVNGQSVAGFADVFRLYQDVRRNPGLTSVSVDIERQGQLVTKTYRIR